MTPLIVLPAAVPRALFPFEPHVLLRRGLRYHYLDEGQGDPVVMVHGNPTWSFYYRELVRTLSPRHRVIVPDHIGMGLSDKPGIERYNYRLADRIDDLEALLASLGLETGAKLTLVMHDWGGMIGMGYAARHPERVGRLVLMNTAAFHLPSDMQLPWVLQAIRDTPLGSLAVRGLNAFSRVASHVGTKRSHLSKVLRDAYCAPYDSWQNRVATYRFVEDIPVKSRHPSYATVTQVEAGLSQFSGTPTLFAWGMKDFVFTPRVLEHWQQRWPQAEVHRFDDCGHYVLEDASAEVCALVDGFLQRHALATGKEQ
ncbi:MAG: alpha/beta fold hydrolase [Deltaproteobacteria bacterium]|nr:alpha/beta fold hydrolase [Deltaproteobacteria bacterium]